jgi:hypothetical protein
MGPVTNGSEGNHDTLNLLLALGDFTVAFSEMISALHRSGAMLLEAPHASESSQVARSPLIDAVYEPLTAAPISKLFFTLCRQAGDLNDSDLNVHRALQRWVDRFIQMRNQVSHADWSVGWVVHDTDRQVPPTAHKLRTSGWISAYTKLDLTSDGVGHAAGKIRYTASLIRAFGNVCRDRQCGKLDVRPSEVVVIHQLASTKRRGAPDLVRHHNDSAPREFTIAPNAMAEYLKSIMRS